jgi:hypothetical protein
VQPPTAQPAHVTVTTMPMRWYMRVRHGAYGYWTWIAVHSRHNFTPDGAATPMRAVGE